MLLQKLNILVRFEKRLLDFTPVLYFASGSRFTNIKTLLSLFYIGNFPMKNFSIRGNCENGAWWISALIIMQPIAHLITQQNWGKMPNLIILWIRAQDIPIWLLFLLIKIWNKITYYAHTLTLKSKHNKLPIKARFTRGHS